LSPPVDLEKELTIERARYMSAASQYRRRTAELVIAQEHIVLLRGALRALWSAYERVGPTTPELRKAHEEIMRETDPYLTKAAGS
jgi:hypothetical protein